MRHLAVLMISFTACAESRFADARVAALEEPGSAGDTTVLEATVDGGLLDGGALDDEHEGLYCCDGFSICDGHFCRSRGGGIPMMSAPYPTFAKVSFHCVADVGQCDEDGGGLNGIR